jgi:hypothetical protein
MERDVLTIMTTRARLVSAEPCPDEPMISPKVFRPLIIRPAILFRPIDSPEPWHVDVEGDLLLPACPPTEHGLTDVVRFYEAFGRICRLTVALAMPTDRSRASLRQLAGPRRRRCIDIFGWAIMIQRPGMTGTASVDSHEYLPGLPAFYECPLELIDRSEFLMARGIPHRPLAVVVRPEDVEDDGCLGRLPRRDRPSPCSIADLLTT